MKAVAIQNRDTQKGSNRNVKSMLSKEGAATQNADALVIDKGEGTNREALTGNENGGTGTERENHGDGAEIEASIQVAHRSFDEMKNMYPRLAG